MNNEQITMDARRILIAARDLIRNSWTTGECARTITGDRCDGNDPSARCWCISGAIDREGRECAPQTRALVRALVWASIGSQAQVGSVAKFNDSTDHAGAIAAMDRAIAMAVPLHCTRMDLILTGRVLPTRAIDWLHDPGLRLCFGLARRHGFAPIMDLVGADLREQVLDCADLTGADLRGAIMDGSSLVGTILDGANCMEASFRGAILDGCSAVGAFFHAANCEGSFWRGATVDFAEFSHARVGCADFTDCDLTRIVT